MAKLMNEPISLVVFTVITATGYINVTNAGTLIKRGHNCVPNVQKRRWPVGQSGSNPVTFNPFLDVPI